MRIEKQQIKVIHQLLPEVIKNDPDQKKQLMYQYTSDWTKTSTKDLTFDQANELIIRFGGKSYSYEHWGLFDYKKTSHRQVLSLLNQLGWQCYDKKFRGLVADIYKFSEWLKSNRSPVKKPFLKMSPSEVSKIIVALENMLG